MRKRTMIWLGPDDGDSSDSLDNYDVHREDAMVSVSWCAEGEREDVEVFIQPSLFDKIRVAMNAAEAMATGSAPATYADFTRWRRDHPAASLGDAARRFRRTPFDALVIWFKAYREQEDGRAQSTT